MKPGCKRKEYIPKILKAYVVSMMVRGYYPEYIGRKLLEMEEILEDINW